MIPFSYAAHLEQFLLLMVLAAEVVLLILYLIIIIQDNKLIRRKVFASFMVLLTFSLLCVLADNYHFHRFEVKIPTLFLWIITILLANYVASSLYFRIQMGDVNMGKGCIRGAIDNLPVGIVYFTEMGSIKLCNNQMYDLYLQMTGHDLQSSQELMDALDDPNQRPNVVKTKDQVLIFPDGRAWTYTIKEIIASDKNKYLEVFFYDVTQLNQKRQELSESSMKLKEMYKELKKLSDNSMDLVREEEIMHAITHLHDQMGGGMLAIRRQLLADSVSKEEMEDALMVWKKTIQMLRAGNSKPQLFDDFEEVLEDASVLGIEIKMDGQLPPFGEARENVVLAIWECMTNGVRHGGADHLYVTIREAADSVICQIRNNGKPPERVIHPRGGLKNLGRNVRACGGTIKIQSRPTFALMIQVPLRKEESL